MAIVSMKDVLGRAEEFEERLAKYYADIRDESQDKGVRLLTYYLSRHRRHLQQVMHDFDHKAIARIKAVQLKYDIPFNPEQELHIMRTPPSEVKGEELLEAAAEYDRALVNLYRAILKQPLNEETSGFVEALIRVEEKDIVMLKKMVAMDYF